MCGEQLKDEADHSCAKEEYYKIQIDALEKLKEPVESEKWKYLTFLYTTWEYLLKAKFLNDLVVNGDECQLLWRSLRERAENEQLYKTDLPEADIPPEVLVAMLGLRKLLRLTIHHYLIERIYCWEIFFLMPERRKFDNT